MDRIGIIFGGRSPEHEVSLKSAVSVINAIDKERHEIVCIGITRDGKWKLYEGDVDALPDSSWEKTAVDLEIGKLPEMVDLIFPVLHGSYGEDGTIQGLFEMLDIPCAGCGVLGSSLAMDKVAAKMVFEASGIPTSPFRLVLVTNVHKDVEKEAALCEEQLPYPMFVKPANAGSSVGISKVNNHAELIAGLEYAARYDRRLIVEAGIDARELETGVIGNDEPLAASVGEIEAANEFYDYEAKYSDDVGTVITVPADISNELREEIRSLAVRTYVALDCAGLSRVDFLVDKKTEKVYVNEVNTLPGFTKYSMFPSLWADEGVEFTELIEKIVEYGYERYRVKDNRKTVYWD